MKKVAFIFTHLASVRERLMIIEGLNEHPGIIPFFSDGETLLGESIAKKDPDFEQSLIDADLIIHFEREHLDCPSLMQLIDDNNLYSKLAYLDFKDSPEIDAFYLERALVYFKRSWTKSGVFFKPDRLKDIPIYPLSYAALSCYFHPSNCGSSLYDVGCFLSETAPGKRGRLARALKSRVQSSAVSFIDELSTVDGAIGRRSITDGPEGNPWVDYWQRLNQVKAVLTAQPHAWDGDSRTWEALASGAAVFLDELSIPLDPPIEHLKHAYLFDASDPKELEGAIDAALDLVKYTPEMVRLIAREGRDFAFKHHRGVHRVNYILEKASLASSF